jgi:putative DNA primase/helicase
MKTIDFVSNKKYRPDDIGTSWLFTDMYEDEIVFCTQSQKSGTWYSYNGKHWQIDTERISNQLIKQFARYYFNAVWSYQFDDEEKRKPYLEIAKKLTSKAYRDTILRDAENNNPKQFNKLFNKNKFLFNCQNGTYDFKKYEFREHDKNDFLTDISNVTYDENADAPRFKQYLEEVMEGKQDKIKYLLQIAAYTLTGDISRECFFVFYGNKTRNGKGTFISTLTHLLGNYSETLKSTTITKKTVNSSGDNASPELAKLPGKRLVTVNELPDNMLLDTELVKTLTGGDEQTARRLYEDPFKYVPEFKLIISTNDLPNMTDDAIFTSDRLHLLEFNRHFDINERDFNLKDKLKTEISGIFNMLIHYNKTIKNKQFDVPEDSKQVLNTYRKRVNNVLSFKQEKLYTDVNGYEKATYVYDKYQDWCKDEAGIRVMSAAKFKEKLCKLGIEFIPKKSLKNKRNGGMWENTSWYTGITFDNPNQLTQQEMIPIDDPDSLPF